MLSGCSSEQEGEEKDVSLNTAEEEVLEVTEMLLPEENSKPRTEALTHVMIHFSSNVVHNSENPYKIEDIYTTFKEYGVSAHYVIDRNGEIYRFVQDDRVAYHAGKGELADFPEYKDRLNHYSIGIELMGIGTKEEMRAFISEEVYDQLESELIGYTDEQYESLNKLLVAIDEHYLDVKMDREYIIGHDEYAPDRKVDPGELFEWERLEVLK